MTLSETTKKFVIGVRLEYGGSENPNPAPLDIDDDPTLIRLCSSTSAQSIDEPSGAEDYDAAPEMEVVYGKRTGTTDEEVTTVDIKGVYLDPEMTSGPFSPVEIEIREKAIGEADDETNVRFLGWVNAFVANPDGRRGTVRMLCFTDKDRLSRRACMPAGSQCPWQVFKKGCTNINTSTGPPSAPTQPGLQGPSIEDYISACTVTTVVGTLVTVQHLDDVGTANGDLWQSGYLELRGLRLKIRDWSKDDVVSEGGGLVTTTFKLTKTPPASWFGTVVRAIPGCPKFPEECELRYNNLPNFAGAGIGIKSYNPMLDSP